MKSLDVGLKSGGIKTVHNPSDVQIQDGALLVFVDGEIKEIYAKGYWVCASTRDY